jgi:hypothetical protein
MNILSVFYIGFMTDFQSDPFTYVNDIRMRAARGADSGLIATEGSENAGMDFYFFKVTGASPYDVITVSCIEADMHPAGGYCSHIAGLTFAQSNPVPEPSILFLLGIGALDLFVWRRAPRNRDARRIMKTVGVRLVGLVLVLASVAGAASAAPVQWSENGNWYEAVLVSTGVQWEDANTEAQIRGGHLATVSNTAENDFVFSLVSTSAYWTDIINGHDRLGPWLGGLRHNEGEWQWVTGEPFDFVAWYSNQPDSAYGTEQRLGFYDCANGAALLRRSWSTR